MASMCLCRSATPDYVVQIQAKQSNLELFCSAMPRMQLGSSITSRSQPCLPFSDCLPIDLPTIYPPPVLECLQTSTAAKLVQTYLSLVKLRLDAASRGWQISLQPNNSHGDPGQHERLALIPKSKQLQAETIHAAYDAVNFWEIEVSLHLHLQGTFPWHRMNFK